jgi:hypothetical protein
VYSEFKQVADNISPNELSNHGGVQVSDVDRSSTTTFVDDSISVATMFPKTMSGVSKLSTPATADPTIAQFLAKPMVISQVVWSTADAAAATILTYDTIAALTSDVFLQKVKGWRMFRGSVVLKVVINAQPFQAGRLLCRFLPFRNNQIAQYNKSHDYDLTTRTQQPNFELDCRDSSGSIEVPWVGPAPWLDLIGTSTSWGTFCIDVLSPLVTGTSGSVNCEVTTFIYFKDVEFAGPICPQSGDKPTGARYRAQMANGPRLRRRVKVSDEQDNIVAGKPISTMLSLSARFAEYASGIPLLSSFAKPSSWALRAASNLASSMGYSKPNLAAQPLFNVTRPLHNLGNCEGTSQAESLSLSADPTLRSLPGFGGTDVDEMSFNYLKMIPAYSGFGTFATSTAVGTDIFRRYIGPAEFQNTGSNGLASPNYATFATYPPYAYIARAFRYWKGSIHIILKFVKTDFHSGRLLVIWTPSDGAVSTDPTIATSAYSMRQIIDLRDTTEVDIELPYMIPRAWQTFTEPSGLLNIQVLNTLQAPDTVAQSVKVLMYSYAGSDFDVAYPANRLACIPYTPQSGDKENTKELGAIGNQATHVDMMEEYTIGEKFTSVKQLIMRYSRLYFNENAVSTIDNCAALRIYPHAIGYFTGDVSSAVSYFAYGGDMYSYIAAGYALARGGMKYNFNFSGSTGVYVDYSFRDYPFLASSGWVLASTAAVPNSFTGTSGATSSKFVMPAGSTGSAFTANPALFVQSTNGVEVQVPPYAQNPSRLIPITWNSNASTPAGYTEQHVSHGCLSIDCTSVATYKKIYRAATDDHQLGYFIGFPPVLTEVS